MALVPSRVFPQVVLRRRCPMADAAPVRRLYELAYGRAGDKGSVANVSVIARSPDAYIELKAKATAERVKAHLGPLVGGKVERFELDTIEALNFVLFDLQTSFLDTRRQVIPVHLTARDIDFIRTEESERLLSVREAGEYQ